VIPRPVANLVFGGTFCGVKKSFIKIKSQKPTYMLPNLDAESAT
jgi:hypothetical protein